MKYRYLVLTILYLLIAFLIDVYPKLPPIGLNYLYWYLLDLLITTVFALATLVYLRFSTGFGSRGQEIFTIFLCAFILMLPMVSYMLPQIVIDFLSNLFHRFGLSYSSLFPHKYAFITISSEIALINAIWNLLSKRQLITV